MADVEQIDAKETKAPSAGQTDDQIVQEAKDRFKLAMDFETEQRELYVDDIKFELGDSDNNWQWDDDLVQEREIDNRPILTINKTAQHNNMIVNDGKQNKASISIRPIGGEASYEAAQAFEGIVRFIERRSNAQVCYDMAFENQVGGGIGFWRLVTRWIPGTMQQEIFIEPVPDSLSVLLDCDIKQRDGSDAGWGFIFDDMSRDRWRIDNPGIAIPAPTDLDTNYPGWFSQKTVRVAEYYRKEYFNDELLMLDGGGHSWMGYRSDIPAALRQLLTPDNIKASRKERRAKIKWYKIGGDRVISKRDVIGEYIPIVRVVGIERIIEGKLERKGHTRAMKSPQRMYNYWSPICLHTPLPTPSGWTTMAAVQPGDWLLDEYGKPVKVAGVSPIHINRKCFKVMFGDGSHIVADGEHRWTVEERGKRKSSTFDWQTKTITTAELQPRKQFIKMAPPLDLPDIDLPIDPYVLGVWLGDGSRSAPQITAGSADINTMIALLRETGCAIGKTSMKKDGSCGAFSVLGMTAALKALGLLGNKHIPAIYLRASRKQREALLQGIMDTDGSVTTKFKQCELTTVLPVLADGHSELFRSLGIKVAVCKREAKARKFPSGQIYQCQEAFQFSFMVGPDRQIFRMPRKRAVHEAKRPTHWRRTGRHSIVSVVEVPSVPVKCVAINSASHLFLAGEGMVPTHNSKATEEIALQSLAPYVGESKAFEGFEGEWGTANRRNKAWIPYNGFDEKNNRPINPPQKQPGPQLADGYLKGLEITQKEMMMASGQYQAQMGENENAKSGVAIGQRQRQGDNATYQYPDNLALAIRYTGTILINWIPLIYDTKQIIDILAEDGTQTKLQIDPTAKEAYMQQKEEDDEAATAVLNPKVGRYFVESDVGPNYATKRQEAFDAFSKIVSSNHELTEIIGDILFANADMPGAMDVAERMKRALRQTKPWVLGQGDTPEIKQAKESLQKMSEMNKELMETLTEERIKTKSKDEMRQIDVFDAHTRRMTAVSNAQPELAKTGQTDALRLLVLQTIAEMMGFDLSTTIKASNAGLQDDIVSPAGGKKMSQLPSGGEPLLGEGGAPPQPDQANGGMPPQPEGQ